MYHAVGIVKPELIVSGGEWKQVMSLERTLKKGNGKKTNYLNPLMKNLKIYVCNVSQYYLRQEEKVFSGSIAC